jgi:hypothetical protein
VVKCENKNYQKDFQQKEKLTKNQKFKHKIDRGWPYFNIFKVMNF